MLFNAALSQSQLATIYADGRSNYGGEESGDLIAQYNYNDDLTSSSTIADSAGSNNGTAYGGVSTSSTATLSATLPSLGENDITATYDSDTSDAQAVTINPAVSLTSSATTAPSGQSITFTATIEPAPADGSTVTFSSNFAGTVSALGTATTTGGVATFTTSSLSLGTQQITASYTDSASSTTGTSQPLAETATGWLDGWSYRKAITVSNVDVASDLAYFPLLVHIDSDSDIGGKVSDTTNGYDIRFTDASGVEMLPYEREDFSDPDGVANGDFWVQVPAILASRRREIYIYYGNASAASGRLDRRNQRQRARRRRCLGERNDHQCRAGMGQRRLRGLFWRVALRLTAYGRLDGQ